MKTYLINFLKYSKYTIVIIIFILFNSYAQDAEELPNNNEPLNISDKSHFPIVVVDMQFIVSRSTAAIQVRQELDSLKKKYGEEVKLEEQELRNLQDELGIQRPILPPDEFVQLESDFRGRVEKLQSKVAEKNKELEMIMQRSIQIIQNKTVEIITNIARERGLAAVLDTSTVVIAAGKINISEEVLKKLNENMPSIDLDAVKGINKESSDN